ncbi:MAG: GxxExxY protein [Candidatus Margulisiibacteriota bacterium]
MASEAKLIYPELSYKLVGILFKAYNNLGGGYQEKIYQSAVRKELKSNKINFMEQVGIDLKYRDNSKHEQERHLL